MEFRRVLFRSDEVEDRGGMTRAVESGMPKLRIEESAARRQAAVDRGEEVVVGVNRYRPAEVDEIEVLDIDNTRVRDSQIARRKTVCANRDAEARAAASEAPTHRADRTVG